MGKNVLSFMERKKKHLKAREPSKAERFLQDQDVVYMKYEGLIKALNYYAFLEEDQEMRTFIEALLLSNLKEGQNFPIVSKKFAAHYVEQIHPKSGSIAAEQFIKWEALLST